MSSVEAEEETGREAAYRERLAAEADFWDQRVTALLGSGRIPAWFDYRRGQDVTFLPADQLKGAGIRANPVLLKLVFGSIVGRIIREATSTKGRALDLGCGAGWLALELARCGMSVQGYDISPGQIEVARRFAAESRESRDPLVHGDFGELEYDVADLNRLELAPGRYDTVVCGGAFHHVERLPHLLREIHKGLKPGGSLIFCEDVGYHGLSKVFPAGLGLLRRIGAWLAGRPGRPGECSPFEGVSRGDILDQVRQRFVIEHLEYRFLFVRLAVVGLGLYRLADRISVPLTRLLMVLDDALIRTGLFRAPVVFAIARRKATQPSRESGTGREA